MEALTFVLAFPLIGGVVLASLPFILSGGLKIVYDLLLYRSFATFRPPEGPHDRLTSRS